MTHVGPTKPGQNPNDPQPSASSQSTADEVFSDEAQTRYDIWRDRAALEQVASAAAGEGEFAELTWMRSMVVAHSQSVAESVPQATFDILWKNVSPRLAEESTAPAKSSANWLAWVSSIFATNRVGWSLAGACATLALGVGLWTSATPGDEVAVARSGEAPKPNQSYGAAGERSGEQGMQGMPPLPDRPGEQSFAGAEAKAVDAPLADARVERIEFGGRMGRISQIDSGRGVTTVIWLAEDASEKPKKVQDL
jgi:hypothetical protein